MDVVKRLSALLLCTALLCACSATGDSGAANDAAAPAAAATATEEAADINTGEADDAEAAAANGDGSLASYFASIAPLENPVPLSIGMTAGALHDFPAYLADKMGGYEAVGIQSEMVYFGNGPLMVEALNADSLDVGGYGIGGILSGSVLGIADIIQVRMDEAVAMKMFVAADSEIAEAGIDPATGLYGTPDLWRGQQVYLAPGTVLHHLTGSALELMGLTFDDIEPVFMDAKNVNTAMYAGQGDAWALWNSFGYADALQEDYVEAFNGEDTGISLFATSVARKNILDDPEKAAAVGKWVECQYAVIDWMQASDENMAEALEYFYEWCQDEGVMAGRDDLRRYMEDCPYYNREASLAALTEKDDDGYIVAQGRILGAMDFFISQENYTEADKEKIDESVFNPSFLEAIQ